MMSGARPIEQKARAALRVSNHAYVVEGDAIRMYGEASKIAADPRVVDAVRRRSHDL
jgi:branched-chain amino acid transport system ATP-binding protein